MSPHSLFSSSFFGGSAARKVLLLRASLADILAFGFGSGMFCRRWTAFECLGISGCLKSIRQAFFNQKILEAHTVKERLSNHKDIENKSEGEDRIWALSGVLASGYADYFKRHVAGSAASLEEML